MPPLSKYENYDKCLFQYPNSTYCVVKTMIKPDASSDIWGLIQVNLFRKVHFNYDSQKHSNSRNSQAESTRIFDTIF